VRATNSASRAAGDDNRVELGWSNRAACVDFAPADLTVGEYWSLGHPLDAVLLKPTATLQVDFSANTWIMWVVPPIDHEVAVATGSPYRESVRAVRPGRDDPARGHDRVMP